MLSGLDVFYYNEVDMVSIMPLLWFIHKKGALKS